MTDSKKGLTDQTLEEVLALMAEEVPPMPADFHNKWTKAVKAEAAQAKPETKKENHHPVVSVTRWTRVLSVAAVFVFLIGGTLIYRTTRKTEPTAVPAALSSKAVMKVTEKPAQEDAGAFLEMEAAEEESDQLVEAPAMNHYMTAMEADAEMEEESQNDASVQADAAAGAFMDTGAATEAREVKNAVADVPMPEVYMTPDPMPTPEETEAKGEETGTAAESPSGFLQTIGSFFKDMGSFLLAVWPYLLILAVPAGAALIFRRKKK